MWDFTLTFSHRLGITWFALVSTKPACNHHNAGRHSQVPFFIAKIAGQGADDADGINDGFLKKLSIKPNHWSCNMLVRYYTKIANWSMAHGFSTLRSCSQVGTHGICFGICLFVNWFHWWITVSIHSTRIAIKCREHGPSRSFHILSQDWVSAQRHISPNMIQGRDAHPPVHLRRIAVVFDQ